MTRPLEGKRIVVTRSREQAPQLTRLLTERGASVIELPVIEIEDPSDGGRALHEALSRLSDYDWVVFTSSNTVERVLPLATVSGLRDLRVAAIGTGTAERLEAAGVHVALVPDEFVAESLVDSFPEASSAESRVLLPRAAVARDVLPEGLRAKGWQVDVVEAYRTELVLPDEEPAMLRTADIITFTSPSTVVNFLKAFGSASLPPAIACIGPITARAAEENGLTVDVVASVHTIEGLADALVSNPSKN